MGFPAGPWGTNCYVVATAPGTECLIIDPGMGAVAGITDVVAEHRLKPVSLLVTHGHVDHVWSVVPLAGSYKSPAYLHPADRHLLTDPAAGISPEVVGMLAGAGYSFAEPDELRELTDATTVELAGVRLRVDHAPGHTAGSVMFSTTDTVFSGDVLFAGSIGRTDLPGGDSATMRRTLADKVLPLADDTVVLPGHGPRTTIGAERASNPYLSARALAGAARGR